MFRVTKKQGLARRAIAFTLFALIVVVYGALEILLPNAASVDSPIVPFARSTRVAVDIASTKPRLTQHAAPNRRTNESH